MPEKLKPCPACGVRRDVDILPEQVMCWNCFCRGSVKASISEAIESWNAMQRPLRWTNEPPKEPGWYWHEEDHEKQPVYVFRAATPEGETALYAQFFGEGDVVHKIERMSGEWAGPIPEPEE